MNRQAKNLGKAFLDAIFQRGGDIVHAGNGEAAVHRAVARYQDFVFHGANANFVAIGKLAKLRRKRIQKILHRAGKTLHFLGTGNARSQRLDVDIDERARIGRVVNVPLEFGGVAMRFPKASCLVHLKMQLDK